MKKILTASAIVATLVVAAPVFAESADQAIDSASHVVDSVGNFVEHTGHAIMHAGKAVTGVIKWTVDTATGFVHDIKDAFVH